MLRLTWRERPNVYVWSTHTYYPNLKDLLRDLKGNLRQLDEVHFGGQNYNDPINYWLNGTRDILKSRSIDQLFNRLISIVRNDADVNIITGSLIIPDGTTDRLRLCRLHVDDKINDYKIDRDSFNAARVDLPKNQPVKVTNKSILKVLKMHNANRIRDTQRLSQPYNKNDAATTSSKVKIVRQSDVKITQRIVPDQIAYDLRSFSEWKNVKWLVIGYFLTLLVKALKPIKRVVNLDQRYVIATTIALIWLLFLIW